MSQLQLIQQKDLPSFQQNLLRQINQTNAKYQQYAQEMKESPFNQYFINDLEEQKKLKRQYPLGQGFRSLYPGLLNYDLPDIYSILVNPEKICPLLNSLMKENQILKEELQISCDDLSKFIGMNDSLIDENKTVVGHLYMKDIDVRKLIESVALDQCEEVLDKNHQIEIFKQENNILIKHIQDSKKKEEESVQIKLRQKNQLKSAKDLNEKVNYDFIQSKEREEELSKVLQLLRSNFDLLSEKNFELQRTQQDTNNQLDYYKNENTQLKEKIDKLEADLDENIEEKNSKLVQQSSFIYGLQVSQDQLKQQLKFHEAQNDQINTLKESLEGENSQLRIMNEQISEESDYYKAQFEHEKIRSEQITLREGELIQQKTHINDKYEELSFMNDEIQREFSLYQVQSEEDIREREKQFDKLFKGAKSKFNEILKEKEEFVVSLEAKVHEQNLEIEQLNYDVQINKNEITDLNQKLLDYNQQKRIIDEQSWDIKQQIEINMNIKQNTQDLKDDNQKLDEEYKIQIEKLEKDIYNFENIIDDQKTKIENQHRVIIHYQNLKDDKEQLQMIITQLQDDNQRVTQEIRRNQEDRDIQESEKDFLMKESTNLKNQLNQIKRQQDQLQDLILENQELRSDLNDFDKEVKRLKLMIEQKDQQQKVYYQEQRKPSQSPPPSKEQDPRKPYGYKGQETSPKFQKQQSPPIREGRRQIEEPPKATFLARQRDRDILTYGTARGQTQQQPQYLQRQEQRSPSVQGQTLQRATREAPTFGQFGVTKPNQVYTYSPPY